MEELDKIIELVLKCLRGIWKNRWIAIAVAWPIMISGVVIVDQMKDRYTASTTVYIDSSSILKPLLRGLAIQSDYREIVRLMIKKLLSRPNLERALQTMKMDLHAETPEQMENLIEKVKQRINISAKKRSNTFVISYSDKDRLRAKRMVQTLLDIFVEDTVDSSVNKSDSAITFLTSQIDKYDKLLRQAEKRREEFKRNNVGLMPNDGVNYYTQLQDNNKNLEQAGLSLEESKNRRNKIKFQLESLNFTARNSAGSNISSEPSALDIRISEQESKLQDLLLLYTEQHPDVINASYVLESLKKRKQIEVENNSVASESNSQVDVGNPIYQELLILLTETEADISTYNTRVLNLEQKKLKLENLVDVVPQIEAEMQRLNRDYEVHRENYNSLVQRLEKARISEDLESDTEQVKFRVIEPPFVSLKPNFPNRGLFDAGVMLLAIIIGYGISLLISLFQPVFYNQNELSSTIGYAVLGTVSKFETDEVVGKRRKNLVLFATANFLFVTVGGILMFIHSKGHVIFNFVNSVNPV